MENEFQSADKGKNNDFPNMKMADKNILLLNISKISELILNKTISQ